MVPLHGAALHFALPLPFLTACRPAFLFRPCVEPKCPLGLILAIVSASPNLSPCKDLFDTLDPYCPCSRSTNKMANQGNLIDPTKGEESTNHETLTDDEAFTTTDERIFDDQEEANHAKGSDKMSQPELDLRQAMGLAASAQEEEAAEADIANGTSPALRAEEGFRLAQVLGLTRLALIFWAVVFLVPDVFWTLLLLLPMGDPGEDLFESKDSSWPFVFFVNPLLLSAMAYLASCIHHGALGFQRPFGLRRHSTISLSFCPHCYSKPRAIYIYIYQGSSEINSVA